MGLPKIDQPLFEVTVPSTGKKAKFRPFTVKEEKILLIAQESKDIDQIILAVKQIIGNCVFGPDVEYMPLFDLEYLLMNIRAKSVNNEVTFNVQDPDTEEDIELTIDINEIEMKHDPDHSKKVELNDEYYMMMRYPTINEIDSLVVKEGESEAEGTFRTMISCIETLVNVKSDEVYKFEDFTNEEITDFVDQFTANTIEGIQNFFITVPKMTYECPYKDNTGKDKVFKMEGMETFFM
jgi:hypothetical protein|tara:strand:+ start:1072 stop:1782 length:711 start_codon:yes stop_codon:yes gene_type:complete